MTKGEQIMALKDSGLSGAQIADKVGCDPGLVSRVLRMGVDGRNKLMNDQRRGRRRKLGLPDFKPVAPALRSAIIEAVRNGDQQKDIAARLGISKGVVSGVVYRAGTTRKIRAST